MHEINIMHIWDTLSANIKSNQIELASNSVVSPLFAVESVETPTVVCLLQIASVVSPPFAVESAVVVYALDADTCSPFCGETLLLPLLP